MCVCMAVCAYVSTGTQAGQKRALDTLKLESQMVVSYTMWVLGTKLTSSANAASIPDPPSPPTPPPSPVEVIYFQSFYSLFLGMGYTTEGHRMN